MSTRTFLCFIRLPQFLELINPIIDSLKLEPVLQRLRSDPIQLIPIERPITIEKIKNMNADRLYLAIKKTSVEGLDPHHFRPAHLGWIQIDLPREKKGILLMTDIGIKTDWYEGDEKYENKDLLKIYNKFISSLKKQLKFPAKIYFIGYPNSVRICDRIGYDQSAKDFLQQGGELMQYGVDTARFLIDDR
jgi:hypothetical protein